MPWKAIACSAKGTSHEKVGSPCQDYADFIKVNDSGDVVNNGDIIIGAVCDGAGSCKHSDIGSQLAVKTALNYLQGCLKRLKNERKDLSPDILKESADQVLEKTVAEVRKAFDAKAQEMGCSPNDLSCTLLVVVATPKWLAAMQIGDGFIVIQQPDSEYQLLFQPIKGEYANETTFVTASNALEKMRVRVVTGEQQFIFASTDGLERIALEIRKKSKPHPGFFDGFKEAIKIRSEEEEKKSTEQWLQSQHINDRTDDDKTILLCWYQSVRVPPEPPTPAPQPSAGATPKSKAISTYQPSAGATPKSEATPAPQPSAGATPKSEATPAPQPSAGATPKSERTPETQSSAGATPKSERTPETQSSGNAISQPNSNPETQSSGVTPAVDPAKKEDFSIEVYAFVINVLAGIFWNSLWHDLWVDIKFNSLPLRNIVGLIIAGLLTGLIWGVNGKIYQQKLKSSKTQSKDKDKVKLFRRMLIICLLGLSLGGLSYYLIREALSYFSSLVESPNTQNTNPIK